MDHDIAVEEFTEESTLVPSDRITWTDSEDPEEGLESQGWTCCWRMEERAAPAGAPVSANIYVHIETGQVLVDLMVLGVRSWLLCCSRLAFLRLTRDWLSELTDLEGHERVDSFLEDTYGRGLAAVGESLSTLGSAPKAAKPPAKRGAKAKSAQPARAEQKRP